MFKAGIEFKHHKIYFKLENLIIQYATYSNVFFSGTSWLNSLISYLEINEPKLRQGVQKKTKSICVHWFKLLHYCYYENNPVLSTSI